MLKRKVLQVILAVLVVLFVYGCQKSGDGAVSSEAPKQGSGEAAATVNGEKVLKSDIEAVVSMYVNNPASAAKGEKMDEAKEKEIRQKVMDNMIEEVLLYQESKPLIKDADKKVEEEYANIIKQYGSEDALLAEVSKNNLTIDKVKLQLKKKITIQNYINNEIINKITATDEELKEYYESNRERFSQPEQVQASHILCKVEEGATKEQKAETLAKIKKVQARLKKGEKFEDLAKEVSDCPSGKNGGDLGFFGKGQMVKPFEEAAFSMKVGEQSDIVETKFGYHIIKVVKKLDAGLKSFKDVKQSIEENLKRQKFQVKIEEKIKELKEKADIQIF